MRWVMAGALLLLGCGDGDCEPLEGSFRATLTEVAGNCGLGTTESIEVVQGGDMSQLPEGCTGFREATADMCAINMDQVCDIFDELTGAYVASVHMRGMLNIESSSAASGNASVTVDDGFTRCDAEVGITWRKL